MDNRNWVKLSSLNAGDVVELDDGFDCHPLGRVTLESENGELFFRCSTGKHFVSGQISDMDNDSLVGIYSVASTPVTEDNHMSDFNPDDANAVSRFFQSIADKVVLASTLAKEVEELRQVVETLKRDVESYRENTLRLDEEVRALRNERAALQDENASLRSEVSSLRGEIERLGHFNENAVAERDRWHNDFIQASTELENVKRSRDDAEMRELHLQEDIERLQRELNLWRANAEEATNRLSAIRGALAA